MNIDLEPTDDNSSPFRDCPHCGDPVLFAVVTGPTTGTVEPCGCSLPPEPFEDSSGN
ncbi:hypothetical protein [Natrinema salinisoli]|uniref:hypothetical protein n=1 Tax=Natrinema salinisoli TaxID=2878535 RepID=UPI001CF0757E|nr:hypothetical protein [Natrinema salinisoli]